MSEQLLRRLEHFRKRHGLSILALCRQMEVHNVTYHRWKKAKKITGAYEKIVKEFLDKNQNIKRAEIITGSQSTLPQSCPKTTSDIAIIGLACFYPGSSNVRELWENILARRVQFRRILDKRLPLSEYYSESPEFPDKTYLTKAAFLENFEFDWSKLRIPKRTFESTDIAHWLALDTALKAFEDAGYNIKDIPLQNTGVIVGNTLTGEQTRSQTLRLRWPYVRKTLQATLANLGMNAEENYRISTEMEKIYKSAFYPMTEDSLAGGLANTIAGRICNYLNLKGGGYIVDGACSSSLLAVITAANALKMGHMDLALAGGVDVSLDPFELVGFARVGALAKDKMLVYDRRANGFLPGEGCGFIVLKRLEDAIKDRNYIYAVIKGWGISSDGKGGIMEPTSEGQALAIQRAYSGLAYKVSDVDFIEGHGTGTTKGDRVELEGITAAFEQSKPKDGKRICGVTSFKSIVGHTKAAAGIGGLIKAALAVNQRVLPPTANCYKPNEIFENNAKYLYPIIRGAIFPPNKTVRAGVSSAGFGGINCHITIESKDAPSEKIKPKIEERALFVNNQETEVFVFAARTVNYLKHIIQRFKEDLRNISLAEMADLAALLNKKVKSFAPIKISIVTDSPEHLYEALNLVEKELENTSLPEGQIYRIKTNNPNTHIIIGNAVKENRIGFLYPGQASQRLNMTRTLIERFEWARDLLKLTSAPLADYIYKPTDRFLTKEEQRDFEQNLARTEITQPAVIFSSLVWTEFLSRLGIVPSAVGGHSLGELSAFYTAGAFNKETLIKFAELRGKLMAGYNGGGMLCLFCHEKQAQELVANIGGNLIIANINSPQQIVVSGGKKELEQITALTKKEGVSTHELNVSNAFHSSFMKNASERIRESLILSDTARLNGLHIYSCMDGSLLKDRVSVREYFSKQAVSPINFIRLVESMSKECDILIEVGPSRVLTDLVKAINSETLCLPIESTPENDKDLNVALAELFVRNVHVQWEELYKNRLIHTFIPASRKKFIENQCERPIKGFKQLERPISLDFQTTEGIITPEMDSSKQEERKEGFLVPQGKDNIANLLIDLTQKMTGFERDSISLDLRLLDDLNLDSIKAAELIAQAAKFLGVTGQIDPSQFSNNTLGQIRDRLHQLASQRIPSGQLPADNVLKRYEHKTWVRNFVVEFKPEEIATKDVNRLKSLSSALVVSEKNEDGLIRGIERFLKNTKTSLQFVQYEELDKGKLSKFSNIDCLIAVLPYGRKDATLDKIVLEQIIRRLSKVISLAMQGSETKDRTIVFVQFGGGDFGQSIGSKSIESCCAKSLASTLHLERPDLRIRIIDFDEQCPSEDIAAKILDEIQIPENFSVAGYDRKLNRKIPIFSNSEPALYKRRNIKWSEKDVVFVSGGAKGITAECALEFARTTKAQVVLAGRSLVPADYKDDNNEIVRTLNRFKKENLQCQYYQCDITNIEEVEKLIKEINKKFGKITGFIHGAGLISLKRLKQANPQEAYQESLPKVIGALNVLNALQKEPPKLILAITSVIGMTGMEGSGWYGFTNEVLTLALKQFKNKYKDTHVQTIAYSIWDEIGMGVRLGSIEKLSEKGVSAIPVKEGVSRFRQLAEYDSGSQDIIVTARVAGLDTWKIPKIQQRKNLRFIENVKYILPGVELIAQAKLNLKDDPYVLDHNWKGTLLFPFVFGLEAMAQAASFVVGVEEVKSLRFEDVHLDRPISVMPESGTIIEIHAVTLDSSNQKDSKKIKVEIYCEHSNFKEPHFAVIAEVNPETPPLKFPKIILKNELKPVDLQPERDLYGNILFQGKLFHRIREIRSLYYYEEAKKGECIFESELIPNNKIAIVDPYFIDSLLQSMQVIAAQDPSLPNFIEEIELLSTGSLVNKEKVNFSTLERIEPDYYLGNAIASAEQHFFKIKNARLKILKHFPNYASANDLVNPSKRDQKIIEEIISSISQELGIELPLFKLTYIEGFKSLSKQKRHKLETPVLKSAVRECLSQNNRRRNFDIRWSDSGKPLLSLKGDNLSISISHKENLLLCVVGKGNQGCDIEIIENRSKDDWLSLLGDKYSNLIDQLANILEDINIAGTSIWSASEAIKKAGKKISELRLEKVCHGGIILSDIWLKDCFVAVVPIKLTVGPKQVISIFKDAALPNVLTTKEDKEKEFFLKKFGFDQDAFGIRVDYSGPQNQYVFSQQFPVTFRTNKLLSRRVFFTNYFDWMGDLREYSIYPIMDKLASLLETGGWGLATNSVKLKILGDLRGNDVVLGRVWMEEVSGQKESIFDLCYEWRKRISPDHYERVALCKQRVTWIKITGHGKGQLEQLPDSIKGFMDSMRPRIKEVKPLENLPEPLKDVDTGDCIGDFSQKKVFLKEHIFDTSLENSNLVGNVYFSNYSKWLGAVSDLFFYEIIPDFYKGIGVNGEFFCLNCDIDYLNEAMPFDKVQVKMYLNKIFNNGMDLDFEFFLNKDGKALKKLAVAKERVVWVKRSANKMSITNIPEEIIKFCTNKIQRPYEH